MTRIGAAQSKLELGAGLSRLVTPSSLTFEVRPKAGQLSLPMRVGSPTRNPSTAGTFCRLCGTCLWLLSLRHSNDGPVGPPDIVSIGWAGRRVRPIRSPTFAFPRTSRPSIVSSPLAWSQLVEHRHERFVRRLTIAGDVELCRALRAADALREDNVGLLIRPEREADAPEFRQSFGLRISSNTCSKRSPWPHRRQRARFDNGHDIPPRNATHETETEAFSCSPSTALDAAR